MKFFSWLIRKLKFVRNQKKDRNRFYRDLEFIRSLSDVSPKKNKALIIKLDDIGDYILFRNNLEPFRNSPAIVNKEIWLIGNLMWKPIFERFDAHTVYHTIWVDKSKWKEDSYRFDIYSQVHKHAFETVYYPSATRRLLLDDLIAHASNAPEIYCRSIDIYFPEWQQIAAKKLIAKEVPFDKNNIMEYEFNKQFFEGLLEEEWQKSPPRLDLNNKGQLKIGIFPGAAHKSKRWPARKFNKLIKLILENYSRYEIVVLGSASDLKRSKELVKGLENDSRVINKTSKTNLVELIEEISTCNLMITNDTSAFHISAALNNKTIILANGVHHKRFIEYPNANIVPVYPRGFLRALKKGKYDKSLKLEAYSKEIKQIEVKRVFEVLSSLLIESHVNAIV